MPTGQLPACQPGATQSSPPPAAYPWLSTSQRPYPMYNSCMSTTDVFEPSEDEIADKPWLFLGYRSFSRWAGSSQDTLVIRRFNTLHARVILFMQDEIARIEHDLEELDKETMKRGRQQSEPWENGSFRQDIVRPRNDLLALLCEKLKAYDDFILAHRQLRAENEASSRCVSNVRNWLHDAGASQIGTRQSDQQNGAIASEEMKFLDTAGDLVPLVPRNKSPLGRMLDHFPSFHRYFLHYCFRIRDRKAHHYRSRNTKYYKESRIESCITMAVTAVELGAIISSLWVMKGKHSETERLWTISGFLVAFTVLLSVVTTAKPYEALAATAAVAAVLVVFIQLPLGVNAS